MVVQHLKFIIARSATVDSPNYIRLVYMNFEIPDHNAICLKNENAGTSSS